MNVPQRLWRARMELGEGAERRRVFKVHEVRQVVVVGIIPAQRSRRLRFKLFG